MPSAPTGVVAEAHGNRTVTVTWRAPARTGGKAITGYRVTESFRDTTRVVRGTSWTGSFATIPAAGD